MKINHFKSLIFLMLNTVLVISSCDNDPCKDTNCGPGGNCMDGTCICEEGYLPNGNGGCKEDLCFNKNCGSNATCNEGICICDSGYEKNAQDSCVLVRVKFLGDFNSMDVCSGTGNSNYVVKIEEGATDEKVLISNLYNYFSNKIEADVDGDEITIDNQNSADNIFSVEGTGTYTNGIITLNYTITEISNGDKDICTGQWQKI